MSKTKKLTPKERLFCEYYLLNFNGADAAVKAGYSKKSAREIAYENLTKPHIQQHIEARTKELLSEIGVNQKRVIEELAAIAFSRVTDFVTVEEVEVEKKVGRKRVSAKVKQVNVRPTKGIPKDKVRALCEIKQTDAGISIKLHDKVSALEKLGRYLKLFTEKVDVTSKGKELKGLTNKITVDFTKAE